MTQSAKLQEIIAPYRTMLDQTEQPMIQLQMKQGKTGPYDSKIAAILTSQKTTNIQLMVKGTL